MLTERRLAQIGLIAALSILLGSMALLFAQDRGGGGTTAPAGKVSQSHLVGNTPDTQVVP